MPSSPCAKHPERESAEPQALRQCQQCRADALQRYADRRTDWPDRYRQHADGSETYT